jgi:hypothetical protein
LVAGTRVLTAMQAGQAKDFYYRQVRRLRVVKHLSLPGINDKVELFQDYLAHQWLSVVGLCQDIEVTDATFDFHLDDTIYRPDVTRSICVPYRDFTSLLQSEPADESQGQHEQRRASVNHGLDFRLLPGGEGVRQFEFLYYFSHVSILLSEYGRMSRNGQNLGILRAPVGDLTNPRRRVKRGWKTEERREKTGE